MFVLLPLDFISCTLVTMDLKTIFHNRGFHVAHLNVRSIFPKIDLLRYHVKTCENIQVLGISETWLHSDLPTNFIDIPGYVCIRNDRNWHIDPSSVKPQKGGGVCLFLRDNLDLDVDTFKFFNRSCKDSEIQWVHVKNRYTKDFIILNLYRPPLGNIENFIDMLDNTISTLEIDKYDIFVMGDFNINMNNTSCSNARSLRNRMKALGFNQLIKDCTRVDLNRESCIDLIFSNCDYIHNSGTFPINMSDHDLVFCNKKRIPQFRPKIEFEGRSYRNFDDDIFTNLLNLCSWDIFDNCDDLDELWNIFISNIHEAIDQLCPLKQFRVKVAVD